MGTIECLVMSLLPWLLLVLPRDTVQQTNSEQIDRLNETLIQVIRQSILQQLYVEQQTRSNGCSGVKQTRIVEDGTRAYYAPSHVGDAVFGIHGHANTDRTIGMAELVMVLNGVEFMTRHNDFHLSKPSTTSGVYGDTEEIEFPDVPPEVLGKPTVNEEILEMREWFNAWITQNYTVRDYRQYFKPLLCYAEGAWTHDDDEYVDEPYFSTRHHIDASTWIELEEQRRFEAYSGIKHSSENTADLPKVVIDITDDGLPVYAQWNYRILCHPLSFDLPLKQLRVIDSLKSRILTQTSLDKYRYTPKARFQVLPADIDPSAETATYNWLLEEMMGEIPGPDNYNGNLNDDGYNGLVVDPPTLKTKNVAYYHRAFRNKLGNRFGSDRRRGFSDQTLFMAMTSQEKVVAMENIRCATATGKFTCDQPRQRWTYAIPLEIIYMTPLLRWNPYNIIYKGDADSHYGKTVSQNDENGSKSKPYNGTNSKVYIQLPYTFFNDDPPDTDDEFPTRGFYVLNSTEDPNAVMASGTPIFLSKLIPDQATDQPIRLRYPIAPVHGEGSAVWKELEALKDAVLKPTTYSYLFDTTTTTSSGTADTMLTLGPSTGADPHTHSVTVSDAIMQAILNGGTEVVTTSQAIQHSHKLKLKQDLSTADCESKIVYTRCDTKTQCFDGHPKCLILSGSV